MIHRCDCHLPFCSGGAAERTDFSIAPGLLGHPFHRVVSIAQRRSQNIPFSFGKKSSSFVLNDISVSLFHPFQSSLHPPGVHFAISVGVKVVRSSGENDRNKIIAFRSINVCCQANAVAHWHHYFLVHDGYFLELIDD